MPVEVLGLENMPNAGDPIQVTESEKDARAFAAKRQELKRFEAAKAVKKITLDNMFAEIDDRKLKNLNSSSKQTCRVVQKHLKHLWKNFLQRKSV